MSDLMDRDAIIDYINGELAYKPGWEIHAMRAPLADDAVLLTVHFTAPNSNRDMARAGYPTDAIVTPVPNHVVIVPEEGAEEGDVLAAVMTWLVDIEIHEAREFLRVRGDDMAAPFHPHRWSGKARWQTMAAQWPTSFPEPQGDMVEGLERDAAESRLAAEDLADYRAWEEAQDANPVAGMSPELVEMLRRAMGTDGPSDLFS